MSYEDLSREELVEALNEMEKKFDEERCEREKFEELAKKTKADFENYRKKQDERKERWQKEAKQELAEDLIEVMDNLERALMAADEETAVVQGVEMVNEQLYSKLNSEGLEVIETGEKFDPEVHKAVDTREHEEHEPKTILEQKRKGYRFDGKVLRAAEVVVSERPRESEDES
ncbi:nucleotide exchange factor GrpE [Candidatus Nanosalina sp. VS9-1]|uniref:nucleotide exchange factor GrpE n=1 Tax=Candidatus Nanosalina sp. VS9-1 TaxID=3388566 RepID=UPI0039DF3A3A